MRVRSLGNYLMNLLVGTAFSSGIVVALTSSLRFRTDDALIVAMVCAFMAAFALAMNYKVSVYPTLITLASLTIVAASLTLYFGAFGEVADYVAWLRAFIYHPTDVSQAYELVTTALLCLLICPFVVASNVRRFTFLPAVLGGASLFVVQILFRFFSSRPALYMFLFAVICYVVMNEYHKARSRGGNDYAGPGQFALWVSVFTAIVLAIVVSLPYSQSPTRWLWLENTLVSIFNRFSPQGNRYYSYDSFALNLFMGSRKSLGGNIELDDSLALEVRADYPQYIRGGVYSVYTGTEWLKGRLGYDSSMRGLNGYYLDTMAMTNAAKVIGNDYLASGPIVDLDVRITYRYVRTKTVFNVLGAYEIVRGSSRPGNAIRTDGLTNSYVDETESSGFSYTVKVKAVEAPVLHRDMLRRSGNGFWEKVGAFIDMSVICAYPEDGSAHPFGDIGSYPPMRSELTEDEVAGMADRVYKDTARYDAAERLQVYMPTSLMLPGSYGGDRAYLPYRGLAYECSPIGVSLTLGEVRRLRANVSMFVDASEGIRDSFLQLPDSLPEMVVTIAQIQSGYGTGITEYDMALSIERYLKRDMFTYSLKPGAVPQGADFVDYFLFQSREGYCSYFASAMVVMLRASGIPARYVEGYYTSGEPEDGVYEVTNRTAHAWVEAYIEGMGWTVFDPTPTTPDPSSGPEQGSGWDDLWNGGEDLASPPHTGNDMSYEYWKEYYENLYKEGGGESAIVAEDGAGVMAVVLSPAVVLPTIPLLAAAFMAFRYKLKKSRHGRSMRGMDPRGLIIRTYSEIMHHLDLQLLPKAPSETPMEYAERLSGTVGFRQFLTGGVSFRKVTEMFNEARYGQGEISGDVRPELAYFHEKISAKTRYALTRTAYFMERYVLCRIFQ
ncbi:MAG: DUF3488 and transglutaminase-like domain-containing protein [Oscillospiraceae bacterium]|nr:DUF3488 and transglutaminase-like domain-containing protein [Oscillospiraceae bacterium]